jgi:glutamine synthetase
VSDKTPDDIFKLAKDEHIEYVDVRFCDLPGTMQHFTIPIYAFDETVFEEGLAFDGSSIPIHPRVRHVAAARSGDRDHRSVSRRQNTDRELLGA